MPLQMAEERAQMIARAALQVVVNRQNFRLTGAAARFYQIKNIQLFDQQPNLDGVELAAQAAFHQLVVQSLKVGRAKLAHRQALRRIGQVVMRQQRGDGVHVRLLGPADVDQRPQRPALAELQIDIAGDFLFFAHVQQVMLFLGAERLGGVRLNALANGRHMLGAVLMPVLHEPGGEDLFHDGVQSELVVHSGRMTPGWFCVNANPDGSATWHLRS